MKMETEESLRSCVNHENGDGRILTFLCELWKRRRMHKWPSAQRKRIRTSGTQRYFSFVASSVFVEFKSQTSKRESVLTEAETEGWAVFIHLRFGRWCEPSFNIIESLQDYRPYA